jgi:hypothetical protein
MCNRPPKIEFAYLNLLPRGYSGPRYIVAVGHRPDGRGQYEERPARRRRIKAGQRRERYAASHFMLEPIHTQDRSAEGG